MAQGIGQKRIREMVSGSLRARLLGLQRACRRMGYVIYSLDPTPGFREVCIKSIDGSRVVRVWEMKPGSWFGEAEIVESVTFITGRERVRSEHVRPWHSSIPLRS